jgi:PAS domain S-box-containing protein
VHSNADPYRAAAEPLTIEALVGPVLDASLDAVVIADADGIIIRVNPAANLIFGHEPGAMIGRSIGDTIVPPHLRAAHQRGMARHAATGQRTVVGRRVELDAWHTSGRIFPVELQIEEVVQGSQRVYAAFIRDLTSQRQMEAEVSRQRDLLHQQEKLTALGTLLGGVAHELNNPLAVVIGRAAMLADALAGSPEESNIKKLRDAANRCHRIVRTFLAMARQSKPQQGAVVINDLLSGVLEFSAYNLRHSAIAVVTDFDPDLTTLPGDHDQLVQVFVALVMNAQQALDPYDGLRRLTVSSSHDGVFASIRVADTGPGIAADIRARAFEPFFTTRAFGSGGGHGLAIARGIVEGHGGTIAFEDTSNQGCTVLVKLPLGRKDRADTAR